MSMRYLPVLIIFSLLSCAYMASADEEIVRLLAYRSEEYMKRLDRKEFLAIRQMLDPETIQSISEDTFLKTMARLYGEATIFYEKPKISITNNASAVAYVKVIYFSKHDISAECQHIYWVQKQGQWFVSGYSSGFSGCP